MSGLTVVEITDPVCPWAWGLEPVLRRFRYVIGPRVRWRRVFGILFDDCDDPAPDEAAETAWYAGELRGIAAHTRAPYPAVLERVAKSSWPASLAAKAAESAGKGVADRVLRRLREQMFLTGVPPDTDERVLAAAGGVAGLDAARLGTVARSARIRAAVAADHAETRRPVPQVMTVRDPGPHNGRAKPVDGGYRYSFPTILLAGPAGRAVVPGWRPLGEYLSAAARVAPGIRIEAPFVDPDVALERYIALTEPDLAALTGGARPRSGVRLSTVSGEFWLRADEALTHPAVRVASNL